MLAGIPALRKLAFWSRDDVNKNLWLEMPEGEGWNLTLNADNGNVAVLATDEGTATFGNGSGSKLYFENGVMRVEGSWYWHGPTSDPHVAGRIWNNAGTLKVSAG